MGSNKVILDAWSAPFLRFVSQPELILERRERFGDTMKIARPDIPELRNFHGNILSSMVTQWLFENLSEARSSVAGWIQVTDLEKVYFSSIIVLHT